MATMELTKVLRFAAAHRLASAALSAAENRRLYGPCFRGHGHNYALEATVRGVVDAEGMVMDATVLEQAMHLCMMMRGVEKQNSKAVTSAMLGTFRDCPMTRSEFVELLKGRSSLI